MPFQLSPGVVTTEIDLTTVIPAVSTTNGGFVGDFSWGPANTVITVDSENTLAAIFGKPDNTNYISFLTAASFLAYGNNLKMVRALHANSNNATGSGVGLKIENDDVWFNNYRISTTTNTSTYATSVRTIGVAAKHPGTLGNTLKVAIFPAGGSALGDITGGLLDVAITANGHLSYNSNGFLTITGGGGTGANISYTVNTTTNTITTVTINDRGTGYTSAPTIATPTGANLTGSNIATFSSNIITTSYASWQYKNFFDARPGTSQYAASKGASNDEIHLVVVDANGLIAQGGTPAGANAAGAVLEVWPNLSVASDAKNWDGSSNFYIDVLAERSNYIRWLAHPANTSNWGTTTANGKTYSAISLFKSSDANGTTFGGGQYDAATDANKISSWDKLKNGDEIDVSLIVTGDASPTVAQHVIDNVVEFRKDCVAFISPASANVVNNPNDEVTDIITQKNTNINRSTSYAVFDSAWKYMFDKYNNTYRWIPLNGDIAGLCVRTDSTNDPWFSPAGLNRGQIKNVVKLSWNPNKTNRDELYKAGVNPIVSFPGEGTVLFGDKTMLTKPSAFDRINVRRLFIVLEKAIATAAKYSLFEFNDEFTRSQFVALVDPFLRDVQSRRGIYDYRVVCDETNNTGEVIDRNEFVGDIYVKPARSINFIQLNFVAVRTGVSFEEVVGRF